MDSSSISTFRHNVNTAQHCHSNCVLTMMHFDTHKYTFQLINRKTHFNIAYSPNHSLGNWYFPRAQRQYWPDILPQVICFQCFHTAGCKSRELVCSSTEVELCKSYESQSSPSSSPSSLAALRRRKWFDVLVPAYNDCLGILAID